MRKKRTHEEFIKEISVLSPNTEILSKFNGVNKKIDCRCKACGHEWTTTAKCLLRKNGCPKCAIKYRANLKRKTHEFFIAQMILINPNIEILSEYQGDGIKVKCKCKADNHIWYATPTNLLQKSGCPKCGGQIKKTHEEFENELRQINNNIILLSEYKGVHEHIKCKCKICGHEWVTRPHELLDEYGCPMCNISRGELKIKLLLEEYSIIYNYQYKFEDCKFYNKLPFDFYLPQYNILIEFDGEQHFKVIDKFGGLDRFIDTKIRDTVKTIYAKDNNIQLIRIPYWDYKNIEKILVKELNLK